MISQAHTGFENDQRDRLLVIGNIPESQPLREMFERDYPELSVHFRKSFLSGIAEASRTPVRAALALVDAQLVHLDQAVAGVRDAIGPLAPLVLCCAPDQEPTAQRLVHESADDYLLVPLARHELDKAIGYARTEAFAQSSVDPTVTLNELESTGALLSVLDARPTELLERLADLIRKGVNAKGATVIVQGSVATSGDVVVDPVLAAPITSDDAVIGQLTLGPCASGAYGLADAEKLKSFATVAAHVLTTASKHRTLRRLAETDECSGLPNRRYLYRHMDQILERARCDRFPVTVLIFDIDDFKSYNDALGHDAGDRIIKTVGEVFRRLCRSQDIVARMGGDEFAVVFWDPEGPRAPGSEHPESALAVLDRVRDALKREPLEGLTQGSAIGGQATKSTFDAGTKLSLTISGGLATFPWDASTRDELLRRADEALLAAKRGGKNRVYLIGSPAAH